MTLFRASAFLSLLLLSLLLVSLPPTLTAHEGEDDTPLTCSNSLFTSPLSLLNHSTLSLHSTPQPPSPSSSCPSSPTTCCTPTADSQIAALMSTLISLRSSLPDRLPSLLLHSLFFHSPHLDLPPSSFATLTPTQHLILRRYSNLLTPILASSTPCFDAVLTYIQGLLCLACDPSSTHYVTAHGRVQLQWPMCGHAIDACQPTLDMLAAATPTLLELFIAFLVAHPTPLPPLTSTTLHHAILLHSLTADVHSDALCTSDALGLYTSTYARFDDCGSFICTALLRGMDWDVMAWLGMTGEEEVVIQVPTMRRTADAAMPAAPAPAHHMHGAARPSPFSLMSLPPPSSRFHVLHANLHGGAEDMPAMQSSDPLQQPLVTMPARPNGSVYGGEGVWNGKPMVTYWGDDKADFYPIWQVGCDGLAQRGVVCPAGEEMVMTAQKYTFLGWVAAAAVVVIALVGFLRHLQGGGEGGDGGAAKAHPTTKARARGKVTKRFSLRKPKPSQDAEAEEGILQQ